MYVFKRFISRAKVLNTIQSIRFGQFHGAEHVTKQTAPYGRRGVVKERATCLTIW